MIDARVKKSGPILLAATLLLAGCNGYPPVNAAIAVNVIGPQGQSLFVGQVVDGSSIGFPTNVSFDRSRCCCRIGAAGTGASMIEGVVKNNGPLPVGAKVKFELFDLEGQPVGIALQWTEPLQPFQTTPLDARGAFRACDEIGSVRLAEVGIRVQETDPPQ